MKLSALKIAAAIATAILAAACSRPAPSERTAAANDSTSFTYSKILSFAGNDSCRIVDIRNPWDSTKLLHTYVLVPDSLPLPEELPSGTLVRTPVRKAVVYSAVHQQLLDRLGAGDAIAGVCDVDYITSPELRRRIADGDVADCGINMSPDIERIMMLRPDAIMLSPYETSGSYGKLGQLGIPIIECADYMELSPLGRAEWIKFFGLLTGRGQVADSLFSATESRYNAIKQLAAAADSRPKVLFDGIYGQGWTVPSSHTTTGIFINDAGGTNPFGYLDGAAGTTTLSPEQVLVQAKDADVWFYRYYMSDDLSLAQLSAQNPFYSRFDAFKNGLVYGCNTAHVPYYDEVPFEPHLLLADMVEILHPGLLGDSVKPRYFTPLK